MATNQAFKQPRSRPAARAPKERLNYPLSAFEGVDNANDPSSIDANMSPDSLNTILDSVGSIESRNGYTKLLTTKIPGGISNNGWPFYKSDNTKQLVYRAGQYLYRYDNAGGSVQLNGSSWTSSTNDDADVFADVLYGCDGTQIYSYNGSTTTIVAAPGIYASPGPQYIRVHKNRLWVASGSSLYFTDPGQPGELGTFSSVATGNVININTNDNQVITGIEVNLDSLVVFKSDSVWVITGEPLGTGNATTIGNLTLRRANSAVGCVAYRTIKKVESVIFFMATDGLYVYQNYATKLISAPVNGTFRSDMNPNAQNLSWALYSPVQKKYLLGYTSGASNTPDKVLCYDTIVNRFTVWDHIPAAWATNFRFNPVDSAVIGDANVGNIYKLFQGFADIAGDNGTATSGTTTTLVDSTKSWTTNQFVDCRVQIVAGTGIGSSATVISNTATTLTVATFATAPGANSTYTIGGYTSYWKTRIMDFDAPDMRKRYKYLKLFMDSESSYNLQVGASIDFAPMTFNLQSVPLSINSRLWDDGLGAWWDQPGYNWDTKSALYKRIGLPGQGRYLQIMFGNFNSNQPWRVFELALEYKLKKASAN